MTLPSRLVLIACLDCPIRHCAVVFTEKSEMSRTASRPVSRCCQRNDQSPSEQVSFHDMLSSSQSVYSGLPNRLQA
jgi:hypothetical protein